MLPLSQAREAAQEEKDAADAAEAAASPSGTSPTASAHSPSSGGARQSQRRGTQQVGPWVASLPSETTPSGTAAEAATTVTRSGSAARSVRGTSSRQVASMTPSGTATEAAAAAAAAATAAASAAAETATASDAWTAVPGALQVVGSSGLWRAMRCEDRAVGFAAYRTCGGSPPPPHFPTDEE